MDPLHAAVKARSLSDVLNCLQHFRVNVNAPSRSDDFTTPLTVASYNGDRDIVIALLAAGANNAGVPHFPKKARWANKKLLQTPKIFTPLHAAAFNGHSPVIEILLMSGASSNILDDKGRTPIHYAAGNGHIAVLQRLFAASSRSVNLRDKDGETPLYLAVRYNCLYAARFLVEVGNADVNTRAHSGFSLLHLACANSCTDVDESMAAFLIKSGARVNDFCDLPKDVTGVEALVLTASPLMTAALQGRHLEVRLLLKEGANIEAIDPRSGRNALHCAVYNGNVAAMEILVEAGAKVDSTDVYGCTPLHFIGRKWCDGYINDINRLVSLLADSGADINARDHEQRTPLLHVIKYCDIAAIPVGGTKYSTRKYRALDELVKRMLEVGADVEACDENGNGILHTLAWLYSHFVPLGSDFKQFMSVFRRLINAGASPTARNAKGLTPAEYLGDKEANTCPRMAKLAPLQVALFATPAGGDRCWHALPKTCPGIGAAIQSVWCTTPNELPTLWEFVDPRLKPSARTLLCCLHRTLPGLCEIQITILSSALS